VVDAVMTWRARSPPHPKKANTRSEGLHVVDDVLVVIHDPHLADAGRSDAEPLELGRADAGRLKGCALDGRVLVAPAVDRFGGPSVLGPAPDCDRSRS